jgi:hypothetical protein
LRNKEQPATCRLKLAPCQGYGLFKTSHFCKYTSGCFEQRVMLCYLLKSNLGYGLIFAHYRLLLNTHLLFVWVWARKKRLEKTLFLLPQIC